MTVYNVSVSLRHQPATYICDAEEQQSLYYVTKTLNIITNLSFSPKKNFTADNLTVRHTG